METKEQLLLPPADKLSIIDAVLNHLQPTPYDQLSITRRYIGVDRNLDKYSWYLAGPEEGTFVLAEFSANRKEAYMEGININNQRVRKWMPVEHLFDSIAVFNFLKLLRNDPDAKIDWPKPKFNPNDIVYAVVRQGYNEGFNEDLKVLSVKPSQSFTSFSYEVLSCIHGTMTYSEHELCSAKDRYKVYYPDYQLAVANINLLPFFALGEQVRVYGGKVRNMLETVVVPATEELIGNLTIIENQ